MVERGRAGQRIFSIFSEDFCFSESSMRVFLPVIARIFDSQGL
jgi:hypothetical protein